MLRITLFVAIALSACSPALLFSSSSSKSGAKNEVEKTQGEVTPTATPGPTASPSWAGVYQYGVSNLELNAYHMTADSSGNVFVVGSTLGTGAVHGNASGTGEQGFFVKHDSLKNVSWSKQLAQPAGGGNRRVQKVVTDSSNNVYTCGTQVELYWQDGTLLGHELIVTKYNSSGVQQWETKLISSTTYDLYCRGVTVDSFNNVYVVASVADDFEGETAIGSIDQILMRFQPTGPLSWIQRSGVAGQRTEPTSVAVNEVTGPDTVCVSGYTDGALGGQVLTGTFDAYLSCFEEDGGPLSTTLLGVAGASTQANDLIFDSAGNILIAGTTSGNLSGETKLGTQDAFVAKFSPLGVLQQTKLFGTASRSNFGTSIDKDSSGNFYLSGSEDYNDGIGHSAFTLKKLDSSLASIWARSLGGIDSVGNAAMILSAGAKVTADAVYIAGTTNKGLGGNSAQGTIDYYIAKYDLSGNLK